MATTDPHLRARRGKADLSGGTTSTCSRSDRAHHVASLTALAVGMLVLLRPKGTPVHKRQGRVYALALLVTSGAALGIYRRGIFFFPHWLAIAALVVTTAGVLAAYFKYRRKPGCTCT